MFLHFASFISIIIFCQFLSSTGKKEERLQIGKKMQVYSEDPGSPCVSRDKLLNEKNSLTLRELIDGLHEAFETDYVNIDRVQYLMASYRSNSAEWKKYAKFDRYR